MRLCFFAAFHHALRRRWRRRAARDPLSRRSPCRAGRACRGGIESPRSRRASTSRAWRSTQARQEVSEEGDRYSSARRSTGSLWSDLSRVKARGVARRRRRASDMGPCAWGSRRRSHLFANRAHCGGYRPLLSCYKTHIVVGRRSPALTFETKCAVRHRRSVIDVRELLRLICYRGPLDR